MDNTREKLIELLETLFCSAAALDIADYLITNGVTVQQWIPVTERLPEEGQRVLSVKEEGYVEINCITNRTGDWFSRAYDPSSVITHWMPLPEPPKGE